MTEKDGMTIGKRLRIVDSDTGEVILDWGEKITLEIIGMARDNWVLQFKPDNAPIIDIPFRVKE